MRSGHQWKHAPKEYRPHNALYNRFTSWSRLGAFTRIFASLSGEGRAPDQIKTDATHLNAHRTAASLLETGMAPAGSDASGAA